MFASNAAVLAVATLVLVLSPATVSFPIALWSWSSSSAGLALMLVLDLLLLRRAFAPLRRLTAVMRARRSAAPGRARAVDAADPEVAELAAARSTRCSRGWRASGARARGGRWRRRRASGVRIARELHDEVGQALTAALLQLDRAGRGTGSASVAEAREAVRAAWRRCGRSPGVCGPRRSTTSGCGRALAALDPRRRVGPACEVARRIARGVPGCDREEELVVYRVAQEALTNVARHAAHAVALELALERRDGAWCSRWRDDGAASSPVLVAKAPGCAACASARCWSAPSSRSSAPGGGTRCGCCSPGGHDAPPACCWPTTT